MEPNSDLIDLLRALNDEGAEYIIVGGYAFAVHGRVRATKDADIFVGTRAENAAKVWRALARFGAPLHELRLEDLSEPDTFFIMGRPPNQIDIITTIDGVSFEDAWSNRLEATYGGVRVNYIGRDDLIANKEAADRPQDRLDVAYLRESLEHRGDQ
jgi:predicted nucleotidyltransferase